jgi:SAM-dependent methyltransferase
LLEKPGGEIASMFDSIAKRYDTLNHLLSGGLDKRWRARAVRELDLAGTERVLDLCTGTADLAVALIDPPRGRGARDVVGIDFSHEMLKIGLAKTRGGSRAGRIHIARGDAMNLPLASASVDAAAIGFGIRNVQAPDVELREIARAPPGRAARHPRVRLPAHSGHCRALQVVLPRGASAYRTRRLETRQGLFVPSRVRRTVPLARGICRHAPRGRI